MGRLAEITVCLADKGPLANAGRIALSHQIAAAAPTAADGTVGWMPHELHSFQLHESIYAVFCPIKMLLCAGQCCVCTSCAMRSRERQFVSLTVICRRLHRCCCRLCLLLLLLASAAAAVVSVAVSIYIYLYIVAVSIKWLTFRGTMNVQWLGNND